MEICARRVLPARTEWRGGDPSAPHRLHSGPENGKIVNSKFRCKVPACGDRQSGVAPLSPRSGAGGASRAPPRVFAKLSGTPPRLLGRPSHCYQSLLGSMFTNSSQPALWILAGALSIGFSNAGQQCSLYIPSFSCTGNKKQNYKVSLLW